MRICAFLASLLCAPALPALGANWPVFGFDPARSGVAGSPRSLTARNVARLRARRQTDLGVVADSSPILLEHVEFARNGTTYGIDAASGRIMWRFETHLTPSSGIVISMLKMVFGPSATNSTPAADPSGRSLYAPGLDGFVHKLDAASGAELRAPGFPLRLTRMPKTEKDASSGYNGDSLP